MNWTDDRFKELEMLWNLLNECREIDSATGVIDRLRRCTELAEALQRSDFVNDRASFYEFVRKLAIDERLREMTC